MNESLDIALLLTHPLYAVSESSTKPLIILLLTSVLEVINKTQGEFDYEFGWLHPEQ